MDMQARLTTSQSRTWDEVSVQEDMGLDCGRYKWSQNQTFAEVAFLIPDKVLSKQVDSIPPPNVHESSSESASSVVYLSLGDQNHPGAKSQGKDHKHILRGSVSTAWAQVDVKLTPSTIRVQIGDRVAMQGELYAEIKRDNSIWFIQDGVLHMQLLKRNRRGNYANGKTNADTFWKSVNTEVLNHHCKDAHAVACITCLMEDP
jgi:hypothetical protein